MKGHLDLLLLAVVSTGSAHGYHIARRLAEASGGALELPEGTLYPALHRMERRGWIEAVHLPPFIRDTEPEAQEGIVLPPDSTAAEAEKHLILETLKRVGNNKTRAARILGLDVKTIRNKLRTYDADS